MKVKIYSFYFIVSFWEEGQHRAPTHFYLRGVLVCMRVLRSNLKNLDPDKKEGGLHCPELIPPPNNINLFLTNVPIL